MPDSDSVLLQIAWLAGSWAVLTGGIWKLSDRIERVASTDAKKALSHWMGTVDAELGAERIGRALASSFDSFFGKKYLSFSAVAKSVMCSMVYVSVLFGIWVATKGSTLIDYDIATFLKGSGTYFLMMSAIPDYISLLKTRWHIALMSDAKSPWVVAMLILSDLAWTVILFRIGFGLFLAYAVWRFDGEPFRPIAGFRATGWKEIVNWVTMQSEYSVMFYATFMSSVWLWLYVMSMVLFRVSRAVGRGTKMLQWSLDREQPFLALGFLSIAIVTCAYIVAGPFLIF